MHSTPRGEDLWWAAEGGDTAEHSEGEAVGQCPAACDFTLMAVNPADCVLPTILNRVPALGQACGRHLGSKGC